MAIRLLVALSSLRTEEPLSVDECDALLRAGGYGVRVEGVNGYSRIVGIPGNRIALPFSPSLWDLYRILIRLGVTRQTYDPGWLHDTAWQIESGAAWSELDAGADGSLAELHRWRALNRSCRRDAVLRLHAVARVPAALAYCQPGSVAADLRPNTLHPAHPGYPGGTVGLDARSLLSPVGDGTVSVLERVIENRVPAELDPLTYFAEFFLRPPLTVFRALLDSHTALLPIGSAGDVAFEFSPELRPTGRVVLTSQPEPTDVDAVATAVWECGRELAAGFLRSEPGRRYRSAEVDAALRAVAVAELRFLRAHTLDLLAGDNPLRRFAHRVDHAQTETLDDVLRRVEAGVQRRRAEPELPRPAVSLWSTDLPGLVRFTRDVVDVGGEVVTGREVAGLDVVAEFHPADRRIEVRRPGDDGAALIDSFERLPSPPPPAHAVDGPALSHTHSVAELQLGELSPRITTRDHVVRLSRADSLALVERLLARSAESADRTVATAQDRLHDEISTADDEATRTVLRVHHLLTRKQFHRGARATYSPEIAVRDMLPFVRRREPIHLVLPGFPVKQADSRLKAAGPLPDLAELAVLVRLTELGRAVRQVYPPGLRVTALTDGLHFRSRSADTVHAYARGMAEYLALVGAGDFVEFCDLDDAAERMLGPGLRERRVRSRERYRERYRAAFAALDVTVQPLWTLRAAAELDPTRVEMVALGGGPRPGFVDMFRSVLHSVPVPSPDGQDQLRWSQAIYADPYEVTEDAARPEVVLGRKRLLRKVWADTIDYMSGLLADRELGYHRMFPEHVRMTLSTPTAGRCGFAPLGGAALLPWHGTAAVNLRGEVSTDFAISLYDQGFVPVHSPLLAAEQPWFMVPANRITVLRPGWAEVEPELLNSIRLRRR